jgi:hypothetical protein
MIRCRSTASWCGSLSPTKLGAERDDAYVGDIRLIAFPEALTPVPPSSTKPACSEITTMKLQKKIQF